MTNSRYDLLKWTTFCAMYVGYMMAVFCRKSFTFVAPALIKDEGFKHEDLGLYK